MCHVFANSCKHGKDLPDYAKGDLNFNMWTLNMTFEKHLCKNNEIQSQMFPGWFTTSHYANKDNKR